MSSHWQPYREPLRVTLVRTGTIALVVGAVLARWWHFPSWASGLARWPIATLLVFWITLTLPSAPIRVIRGKKPSSYLLGWAYISKWCGRRFARPLRIGRTAASTI